MTIPIKMEECPRTKATRPIHQTTMKTELVCPCGKRLEVSVRKNGWWTSLIVVAAASLWNIDRYADIAWGKEIPAFCPHCRIKP